MPEPTYQEILDKLIDALTEIVENLKRIIAREALGKLVLNSDTKNFKPAVWSPPQTNEDTTDADIDALSVTDLDTWLAQNKTEVERLMGPQ